MELAVGVPDHLFHLRGSVCCNEMKPQAVTRIPSWANSYKAVIALSDSRGDLEFGQGENAGSLGLFFCWRCHGTKPGIANHDYDLL